MNEQVLKEIEHRLNRAGKFMLTRCDTPGNLVIADGVWTLKDDAKECTVLEALLLGQEAKGWGEGDAIGMMAEATISLGMTIGELPFVAGFLKGANFKHGFLNRK